MWFERLKIKRWTRQLGLASTAVLLLAYQNCSKANFSSPQTEAFASLSTGANDLLLTVTIAIPKNVGVNDLQLTGFDLSKINFFLLDASGNRVDSLSNDFSSITLTSTGGQNTYQYLTRTLNARTFQFLVTDIFGNSAKMKITFSPENPFLAFKPALAVRNTNCLFCHASIQGNVITDMAFSSGKQGTFLGDPAGGSGEYLAGDFSWQSENFLSTNYIQGTLYMPRREISTSSQNMAAGFLRNSLGNMPTLPNFTNATKAPNAPIYTNTIPLSFQSIAQYANSVLNYRTPDYLNFLKSPYANPSPVDATITSPGPQIREIKDLTIQSPTAAQLKQVFGTASPLVYIKQSDDGYDLTNFAKSGNYYTNLAGNWMQCDGDLFVDGVVFLNNLKLRTKYGCRIYSTHSVFIQAPAGTSLRDGITYDTAVSSKPYLEITSANSVIMGLGVLTGGATCTVGVNKYTDTVTCRSHDERTLNTPTLSGSGALADYAMLGGAMMDVGNGAAAGDGHRAVSLSHLLINAPLVHSRFSGDFKGVIIAQHMVGSLGKFSYHYDDTFTSVPILPQISSSWFFQMSDCATYDSTTGALISDQSTAVSGQAKLRTCF
jgi:hypothetical protein